jgi:hypothetical protein
MSNCNCNYCKCYSHITVVTRQSENQSSGGSIGYTGCLKIREFRIQSVVGDHFSSPNMEIKKKSGLPPQRYIGLKVHSLKCVFFKCRLKSSVFIVIYGVDDRGK